MKELLQQLSGYSIWANRVLIEVINSLPEELQKKEIASSFSSLYKTLLHMWDAESIWWKRIQAEETIIAPSLNFAGSTKEMYDALLQRNKEWQQWIAAMQEDQLTGILEYRSLKGQAFKQPLYQVLLHLFNHGTYHRGQLVNMLRQLNVQEIPATDFIVWSRKNDLQIC